MQFFSIQGYNKRLELRRLEARIAEIFPTEVVSRAITGILHNRLHSEQIGEG